MSADRFATRRGVSPGGIGFAVGMTGLVVIGLMTAAPKLIPASFNPPFRIIQIDAPKPPPLEQPKPQPQRIARQETQIQRVDPTIKVQPTDILRPITTVDVASHGDPGLLPGNGDGGVKIDPPKPPVLVKANVDPRYARDFQPFYPPSERRVGNEGRVVVRVLIGTDGRVHAVEPVSATSEAFLEATRRRALERWRFKPATRDGEPVESWQQMAVRFVLSEQD